VSARAVHQLVAALTPGDAVGNHAFAIRAQLRAAGFDSEIFTDRAHPRAAAEARPLWQYRQAAAKDSVCLLHFAIGSPATRLYAGLAGPRVMVYHNVTPPDFFVGWSRELVRLCHDGRRELLALRAQTDLALGVSEFNRRDLERAGYSRTGVLPIVPVLDGPARPASPVLRRLLDDGRDNLLFVGRVAPNKRIEDLVRTFAVYQRFVQPASRLLIVGDHRGQERYLGALLRLVDDFRLDEVVFTGHVDDDELRACYRAAHAFVSLSEHEGYGVPLLEAMAFELPVVAFDAAAVRETLAGAGVLLREKRPDELAELLHGLIHDPQLREAVLAGQRGALSRLRGVDAGALLLERLRPVLEAA